MALFLRLAVLEASHPLKVYTSVKNEEEVIPCSIVCVGLGLVLNYDLLAPHIWAPHIDKVLVKHDRLFLGVIKLGTLNWLVVSVWLTILALQPESSEVLVLGAWGDRARLSCAHLVGDKELLVVDLLERPRAIQLLCDDFRRAC